MKKGKTKSKSRASDAERKAQRDTELAFAAEAIVQRMLTEAEFVFVEDDDDAAMGACQLYGTEDARDKAGVGGAWAIVRFYIPNMDLDAEIDE